MSNNTIDGIENIPKDQYHFYALSYTKHKGGGMYGAIRYSDYFT